MAEETTVYGSLDEIMSDGAGEVEYAEIEGFRPGKMIRIGSVTAGDIIEWSEAGQGEAKRTAGLRLICKSLVGPAPGNIRYANNDKFIKQLREVRHKDAERIVQAIMDLNKMSVKKDEKVKND